MLKAERQKLPKSSILRGRRAFEALFSSKAKILHQSGLSFRFLYEQNPASGAYEVQIAFISPKKLGDAPLRNRARRRLKEVYRKQRNTFEAKLRKSTFSLPFKGSLILKRADLSVEEMQSQLDSLLEASLSFIEAKGAKQ